MTRNTTMIHYQITDGVATIVMNSEPVNALGLAMRRSLIDHLQRAIDDEQVKAIVIASDLSLFCVHGGLVFQRNGR